MARASTAARAKADAAASTEAPAPPADPKVISRDYYNRLHREGRMEEWCRARGFGYRGAVIVGNTATLR